MSDLRFLIELQTAVAVCHQHRTEGKGECKCRYCVATREYSRLLKQKKEKKEVKV